VLAVDRTVWKRGEASRAPDSGALVGWGPGIRVLSWSFSHRAVPARAVPLTDGSRSPPPPFPPAAAALLPPPACAALAVSDLPPEPHGSGFPFGQLGGGTWALPSERSRRFHRSRASTLVACGATLAVPTGARHPSGVTPAAGGGDAAPPSVAFAAGACGRHVTSG